jgi:EAL domain-containing protein (putative c-di-GMP-specific phosphodiesterase class I)/GGDEF domain-containing protein
MVLLRARQALSAPVIVALVAVLLGGGVLAKLADGRAADEQFARAVAATMDAEAAGIGRATSPRELSDLLGVIAARPGMRRVVLVDLAGRVVASGTPSIPVGATRRDPEIAAVLSRGGAVTAPGGARAVAVRFGGRRHAYAVTRERWAGSTPAIGASDIPFLLAALLLVGTIVSRRLRAQHATGLRSRDALDGELARATAHATRHVESLALILLRADSHVTRAMQTRIARILRDGRLGDSAFRAAPGAFAVVLPRTGLDGAVEVAHRLVHRLSRAGVPLRAAAGALQPGQDADGLRADVQAALDAAPSSGPPAVTDPLGELVSVAPDRATALHHVLSTGAITCHYQPIWHLDSGDLLAVEALARISDAHGFNGPSQAFDVAERTGRVHELDTLCVTRALEGATRLPSGAVLFVNLAPQTLDRDSDGDSWLPEAVERSALDASQVVIEVTERVGARIEPVLRSIEHLRAAGLRIALDDVGAGNSGLEMLRRVRPDFVKIDRTVVVEARHDRGARAVLAAITAFAAQTGAYVIAEGIEDDSVLDLVRDADGTMGHRAPRIDGGQGYRLGRPAPVMPERVLAPA